MTISWGSLVQYSLLVTSVIYLLMARSTSASADCPTRRFANIDQEATFLMRVSPIIFVGKVTRTRLIKKSTETTAPIFEDEYVIKDTIRGSNLGSRIFLEVGSIGDGDEPPKDAEGYAAYIKSRAGLELIVLTIGYVDENGHYRLVATGDCPEISGATTPHGRDLIAAMKRRVELEEQ